MTILEAIMLFLVFCLISAIIRLLERIGEGYLLKRRQDDLLDAAYSKIVRLAGRAVADFRRISGGDSNDEM